MLHSVGVRGIMAMAVNVICSSDPFSLRRWCCPVRVTRRRCHCTTGGACTVRTLALRSLVFNPEVVVSWKQDRCHFDGWGGV